MCLFNVKQTIFCPQRLVTYYRAFEEKTNEMCTCSTSQQYNLHIPATLTCFNICEHILISCRVTMYLDLLCSLARPNEKQVESLLRLFCWPRQEVWDVPPGGPGQEVPDVLPLAWSGEEPPEVGPLPGPGKKVGHDVPVAGLGALWGPGGPGVELVQDGLPVGGSLAGPDQKVWEGLLTLGITRLLPTSAKPAGKVSSGNIFKSHCAPLRIPTWPKLLQVMLTHKFQQVNNDLTF